MKENSKDSDKMIMMWLLGYASKRLPQVNDRALDISSSWEIAYLNFSTPPYPRVPRKKARARVGYVLGYPARGKSG